MFDQDRNAFVSTFIESLHPGETQRRAGRRMLVVAAATVLAVAAGALLNGALGSGRASGSPAGASNPVTTRTPAVAPPTWSRIAGPDCTSTESAFTAAGRNTGGWRTEASGGYRGDGCTGGFLAMPLSGHATTYDVGRYVQWTFDLAAGLGAPDCVISVYVPNGETPAVVGGDPAYYYVYNIRYTEAAIGRPTGQFEVTQTTDRGRWVTGIGFPVSSGHVTLRLVDAGVTGTAATKFAHVAAAEARLSCGPA